MCDDTLQKVGRKIVQAVVAAVFKLPDSNGLAGARKPRDDDELGGKTDGVGHDGALV